MVFSSELPYLPLLYLVPSLKALEKDTPSGTSSADLYLLPAPRPPMCHSERGCSAPFLALPDAKNPPRSNSSE